MVDISIPNVLYLNTNNLTSYSEGLYQKENNLEIPKNSCYMLSSYETKWPYSDKFITIIRDNDGRYHLLNHNLFVDVTKSIFQKEKCNYVYQDVVPLISYNEWLKIVKLFKKKTKSVRSKEYLKIFNKNKNWNFLFGKKTHKISFNQSFQLFRFLEISSQEEFNSFLTLKKFSLIPNNNWNWKLWNNGLNKINTHFSKFQNKLIYSGFVKNLKFYKLHLKFNIKDLKILIGRIDGRYAGVISINYCHPDKYLNFWKDYKQFKNNNIVSLPTNEIPNILKLPKEHFKIFNNNTIDIFNKYVDKFGKQKNIGFFNKESETFLKFISTSNKYIKNLPIKVIIIGSNNNGISYANSIKNEYKNHKKTKKKSYTN